MKHKTNWKRLIVVFAAGVLVGVLLSQGHIHINAQKGDVKVELEINE